MEEIISELIDLSFQFRAGVYSESEYEAECTALILMQMQDELDALYESYIHGSYTREEYEREYDKILTAYGMEKEE